MTIVRISPTRIIAEGHTDRELCIAISAMVQTAGAILDQLGFAHETVLDAKLGLYSVAWERDGRRARAVRNALGRQLVELAEDHPGRLIVDIDPDARSPAY